MTQHHLVVSIQLLDDRKFGDRIISSSSLGSSNNNNSMGTVAARMARSVDNEGLSPVQLLGWTSEKDLGRCRSSLMYSWGRSVENVGSGRRREVDEDDHNDHFGEERRGRSSSVRVEGRRRGTFDLNLDYHDNEQPPRDVDHIDTNFGILGNEINHH